MRISGHKCLSARGETSSEQVARQFKRSRTASVQPLLQSLTALGPARIDDKGRFAL